MADAARLPHLAVPFAIAGAAAGWLCAGLLRHSLLDATLADLRALTALAAGSAGALVGLVVWTWCAGGRVPFGLEDPPEPGDPETRPSSDSWARHGPVLLITFGSVGALFAHDVRRWGVTTGFFGGAAFALTFVPVFAAVLSAARRAQRARPGSIVASSDRRAVWSVLAAALVVASLSGLPDWPAPREKPFFGPEPLVGVLVLSGLCLTSVLFFDVLAFWRAKAIVTAELAAVHADDLRAADATAPRLDLGLGEDLHARLSRTRAVYREPDRTLSLVRGDPEQALTALRRAIRRGILGLAALAAVSGLHAAAAGDRALVAYESWRCERGHEPSCSSAVLISAADGLDPSEAGGAVRLYERACDRADGWSCLMLSRLYRGTPGVERDVALATLFEYRAAQRGRCPEGTHLVTGQENVCVTPDDPRAPNGW